jgi:methionyl-tRNA synthetase
MRKIFLSEYIHHQTLKLISNKASQLLSASSKTTPGRNNVTKLPQFCKISENRCDNCDQTHAPITPTTPQAPITPTTPQAPITPCTHFK